MRIYKKKHSDGTSFLPARFHQMDEEYLDHPCAGTHAVLFMLSLSLIAGLNIDSHIKQKR